MLQMQSGPGAVTMVLSLSALHMAWSGADLNPSNYGLAEVLLESLHKENYSANSTLFKKG